MLRYRAATSFGPDSSASMLIVLVILVGLQPQQLLSLASSIRYQALFSEAGGLAPGNRVTVSGIKVGTVSGVSLQNGEALVTFDYSQQNPARLGYQRAHPNRIVAGRAGAHLGVRRQRQDAPDGRDTGFSRHPLRTRSPRLSAT